MNSPIILTLDLQYEKNRNNGTKLLVNGRPITKSLNPLESLNQILVDIE